MKNTYLYSSARFSSQVATSFSLQHSFSGVSVLLLIQTRLLLVLIISKVCMQIYSVQRSSIHFLLQSFKDASLQPSLTPVPSPLQSCLSLPPIPPKRSVYDYCFSSHLTLIYQPLLASHHPREATLAKFTSNLQTVLSSGKSQAISCLTSQLPLTKIIPPAVLKLIYSSIPRAPTLS